MGAPSINIAFYEQAIQAIQHGDKGVLAMIVRENLPAAVETETRYEKSASDLMGGDVRILSDGSVVGTFPLVEDYTGFSKEEKEGYYFAIKLADEYKGMAVTVKRTSNGGGTEKTDSTDNYWVLKLTDGVDTVYEFKLQDAEKPFLTLNFAGATLLPKGRKAQAEKVLNVERFKILDAADIPESLSDENTLQIKKALIGYQTAPKKILLAVIHDAEDYDDALASLSADNWDYLACPTVKTDEKAEEVVSWIKNQRGNSHKTYKAVLPDEAADYEGIINVANGYTDMDGNILTAEKSCARVAGIICGTPWSIACTYAPLTDAIACDVMEPDEIDAAVEAGKLVFIWDGEKAKICRGVNSFVSTMDGKGNSYKKIKLVEIMDLIQSDIRRTMEDSYIGKYPNTYDNKCLLITAINGYFDTLVSENILESGLCEIDIDANRNYIKERGGKFVVDGETVTLENATEQQIKEANTGSNVFLKATISMIDAIEDITINIYF